MIPSTQTRIATLASQTLHATSEPLDILDGIAAVGTCTRLVASACLCGLVLIAPPVRAATYYAAPNGANVATGAVDDPVDLATAVAKAGPGDVVILMDGMYAGQGMSLTRSGAAGSPITFRAAEGAVPVLDGGPNDNGNGVNAGALHDVVLEGLWLQNFRYGGISFGWDNPGADSIAVRYCVADQNGMNGINFFWASNVTVEHNIASRNGWGPDSWSSNINLWAVRGSNNVVRGNVAFHGVDTSSNNSDGNGYILDVSVNDGSALFEDNIGFLNGGACIAVCDSSGARLVNNTCYHNAQKTAREFNFADTCRGDFEGISITGHYALVNVVFRNNVAFADTGKNPLNLWSCGDSTAWVNSRVEANTLTTGDGASEFADTEARDFRLKAASALVDTAASTDAYGFDNGFDPKCIKRETGQRFAFWTNAPDLDYIRSIGGIKSCFHPVARPQGAALDIGAYEFSSGATATGGGDAGGSSGLGGENNGGQSSPPTSTTTSSTDANLGAASAPGGGGCACRAPLSLPHNRAWLLMAALICIGWHARRGWRAA